MTPFMPDQWIILALLFLLGLFVGMYVLSGGRWKRRYQDERQRCEALEVENSKLRTEARELASLRHAATKTSPAAVDRDPI